MTLNILPKWQNVAESGHTGLNTLYPNRLEGGFCDFPVSTFLPSYLERYVCFCLFLESKMLRGESCKRRRRKRNLSWKDAEICFEKKNPQLTDPKTFFAHLSWKLWRNEKVNSSSAKIIFCSQNRVARSSFKAAVVLLRRSCTSH